MGQKATFFFFFCCLSQSLKSDFIKEKEKICKLYSWMSVYCGQRRPQLPILLHSNFIVTNQTASFCQAKLLPVALLLRKLCQMWWNFQISTVPELTEKSRCQKYLESSLTSNCKLEGWRVSVIVFHRGAEGIQDRMVVWKPSWRRQLWTAVWLLLISWPGAKPAVTLNAQHQFVFVHWKWNSEVQV